VTAIVAGLQYVAPASRQWFECKPKGWITVLYVLSKVSGVPFERCVTATLPFLVPLLIVLLKLTFIPELSMWLPSKVYD
jgi:TRAP-type C4-dicarboxylate transport system permease large subunit